MDALLRPLQLRQRAGATESSRYPWRWSLERLLRGLNTERACSADTSTECWLIDDLASWNQALRPARLVLTEFEPGKLCLRSYDDRDDFGARFRNGGNENDGAFLMAWLPRQHLCIHEVRVHDRVHVERLSFVASFIVGPAPNLQRVVVRPRYRLEPECGLLDAFGPPQCLRDLELSYVHIGDSLAPKVAEVLRANAASLATVKLVGNQLSPESAATLLLALVACRRLTELSLQDSVRSSACDAIAEVFRSNRVIRKVALFGLCKAGTTCKHSGLQGHATSRHVCLHCVTDLFAALEGNLSFQHLTLESTNVGRTIGEALAHFLMRHHPLETLALKNCSIDGEGATHIAEALLTNCTLESLSLLDSSFEGDVVTRLCHALSSNATLKTLLLPEVLGSSHNAEDDQVLLETLKLEPRAQFPLSLHLPASVSPSLACGLSCATDVQVCHWGLVGEALRSVYATLASNRALRSLTVEYVGGGASFGGGGPGGLEDDMEDEVANVTELGDALCAALKASQGLRRFRLDVRRAYDDSEDSVPLSEIFAALASGPCLRQVTLSVPRLDHLTAQLLAILVGQCRRSLVEVNIKSSDAIPESSISVLQNMLARNPFLSKMTIRSSAWDDIARASAAIDDAVEHNVGLLNKATRFVFSVNAGTAATGVERRWAAAFDELCGTASLLEHLARLSKKPQPEVLLDVNKAKRFLQENYLVIAGVVYASVTCGLGDGSTQLDALNVDCWRAVARYLKLSDIFTC